MKYDFSGYATKNGLVCSDGRVINKDAFENNNGKKVPLVWQHMHDDPSNILGHAVLENRADGVYAYCKFNDTDAGLNSKKLVEHGDIVAMSIYANKLKQNGPNVIHGDIKEVSLVLSPANPGALIDNLNFAHTDGEMTIIEDEAIIYTGMPFSTEEVAHAEKDKPKTVQDVFDTFNEEQKNVVYAIVADLLASEKEEEKKEEEPPKEEDKKIEHSDEGGNTMKKNVFEKEDAQAQGKTLSHSDMMGIVRDARDNERSSLKAAFLAHVQTYGIENIGYLFPDAQNLTGKPEFVSRDMGWVPDVLAATKKSPFSRIKTIFADITADEARAKGYVTGAEKKDEVFTLLKRSTTPTTIYKKQKLDRDDVVDITDLDTITWVKAEMRVMLDEEVGRAIFVGDGRAVDHADKINEACVRPINKDEEFYAHHVALANDIATKDLIDSIIASREFYKGSGNPKLYTTTKTLTDMLLLKDTLGRRLYGTVAELASALMVKEIVEVPVLANVTRVRSGDDKVMTLVAILVNLVDYVIGADKGGQVNMFDDFDIDFNQYKYLMETRISGALARPKSALVFEKLPVVVG